MFFSSTTVDGEVYRNFSDSYETKTEKVWSIKNLDLTVTTAVFRLPPVFVHCLVPVCVLVFFFFFIMVYVIVKWKCFI